ncbi:hypothetical protein PG993_004545 [Apiospora rasikravindrae]|uniref:Uncharacterized protein n=1 Tax=Apiospora rasikravindrae TaxID=990691 RepID=A0ABR1TD16_9PEZI
MPYPVGYRATRKQPEAGSSTSGSSQSRWNNVPNLSLEDGNDAVADDNYIDVLNAAIDALDAASSQVPPPLPPKPTTSSKRARTPAERERELNYALVAAHRNLTRMSQYVLKLEARANLATKEDLRQTLEATYENNEHSSSASSELDEEHRRHEQLVEDVSRLSDQVWTRLYLVDKSFRRVSRKNRQGADGPSGPITLQGETHTKTWLERVIESNALLEEETLFYTVRDMAAGRSLADWFGYIRDLCKNGAEPVREDRVVAIAWSFLDRAIRPPSRPGLSTTVDQFTKEWEALRRGGAFDGALDNPWNQQDSDEEILKSLKGVWSARQRPL